MHYDKYRGVKYDDAERIESRKTINTATEASDVDLLISTNVRGLKFYGLVEEIRSAFHKKVDVLDLNQLSDNFELTKEILRDGIKIYG